MLQPDFEAVRRILVPNLTDCTRAGRMLARLGQEHGFESIGRSRMTGGCPRKTNRRVVDWYHISMRLRPIKQMSSEIASSATDSSDFILTELLIPPAPG